VSRDTTPLLHGVVELEKPNGLFHVRVAGAKQECFASQALLRTGVVIREGDRVMVRTQEGGVFRGEIMRVRPAAVAHPRKPAPEPASLVSRPASVMKPADQRLDRSARPGWPTGVECPPRVGDEVYCTAGSGRVLRLLGKTGNGSRLLELRLAGQLRTSFFAAASNVVVAPRESDPGAGSAATVQ